LHESGSSWSLCLQILPDHSLHHSGCRYGVLVRLVLVVIDPAIFAGDCHRFLVDDPQQSIQDRGFVIRQDRPDAAYGFA